MSVATVPIPFTETLTPLRWPLLVHELAHWYLPGGRSLSDIADIKLQERFGDVSAETKSTFEEIFADLVAFRAHGLTYCLAFALEAYLSSPAETTAQLLPSPRRRLRLLATDDFPWLVDGSIPSIWPLDAGGGITDERLIEISEVALELLADFQPPRSKATAVQQARHLLARGEAASAAHADQQDISDESFASLLAEGDFDMAAHQHWLFAAATDEPCSDAEVLEAAWLLEVDRPPVEILAELTARDASLDDAVAALATRDTSISRSLQSAAVHRWLREWDETIAANVDRGRSTAAVALPATDATGWTEDSPLSDLQLVRRLTRPGEDALVIRPLIDPSQIGGTTIDLRLGTEWEQLRTSRFQALDPGADPEITGELLDNSADEYRLTAGRDQSVVLHPGELLLALTLEYLRLPDDLWGNIEGRSTWARLGLQVHATAGMVDCGFRGYLTLELQNTGRLPLVLFPGLRVAQMAFFPVHQVLNPYHGKPSAAYSAQTSARSAFHRQHEHKAMHRFLTDPKSRS
jgi:dCTP deaminase